MHLRQGRTAAVADVARAAGIAAAPCSLHAIDRRLGVLAEVLVPGFLYTWVVLLRLDRVHEVDDVRLKATLQLLVGDPALAVEGLVRSGQREHVRVDARPEVLEG